jgi:hypothetical protein
MANQCDYPGLYEIHDPARYLTPDVVADFSRVTVEEISRDRVHIQGATGRSRPETLKVPVGVIEGFAGVGQISSAGPGARARGELALDTVKQNSAKPWLDLRRAHARLPASNAQKRSISWPVLK